MENSNTRVLAYQVAQVIPDEQLQAISGGTDLVRNSTFRISSPANAADLDFIFDSEAMG